jgi:hypothetical protein
MTYPRDFPFWLSPIPFTDGMMEHESHAVTFPWFFLRLLLSLPEYHQPNQLPVFAESCYLKEIL